MEKLGWRDPCSAWCVCGGHRSHPSCCREGESAHLFASHVNPQAPGKQAYCSQVTGDKTEAWVANLLLVAGEDQNPAWAVSKATTFVLSRAAL